MTTIRRRADDEEEEELLTPFGEGGRGGRPPALTGGSTVRARTARPSRTFEDLAAGAEAQREVALAMLPPAPATLDELRQAFLQTYVAPPPAPPPAPYFETQLQPGFERGIDPETAEPFFTVGVGGERVPAEEATRQVEVTPPGPPLGALTPDQTANVYRGFLSPGQRYHRAGTLSNAEVAFLRSLEPEAQSFELAEGNEAWGVPSGYLPAGYADYGREATLVPASLPEGNQGQLLGLLQKNFRGGTLVNQLPELVGSGQLPDLTRQLKAEPRMQNAWWNSGPLGALLNFVPVVGGFKNIAQGIEGGNIFQTLAGVANILASAAGGMGAGGVGGAGGAEAAGGFGGAGEAAGGFEGLAGGSFLAPTAPAPFPTGPEPFGTLASTVHPEAAGISLGNIAPTAAEQAAGTGPFGMLDFGSATPTAAGGFGSLTERLLPRNIGEAALSGTSEALGQFGGPSGPQVPEMPTFGTQPAAEAPLPAIGAAPTTQRAQTGTARVAGAGGPTEPALPELGARPERPEDLEERLRAQGFGRLAAGAAIPSFGTFR